jgi:hypothetical protein
MRLKSYQQLLLDTADWLERHGWCQGRLRIGKACCIIWALSEAQRAGKYPDHAHAQAHSKLMIEVGATLSIWNDSLPASTGKATVIAALRKAAV